MKKTLVEASNLDAHICQETKSVYVDGSIILTAGAKDELRKRGIDLVYGPNPKAAGGCAAVAASFGCTDAEEMLIAVAALLKKEYGITDPESLKAASHQIVKTLQESL